MKTVSIFSCQKCGAQTPKWMGQCPECGKWGTLIEELQTSGFRQISGRSKRETKLWKLKEIKMDQTKRTKTGINELDRVLGGGIVPGSVVLFAGEPGIGKSTLLTQIALKLTTGHRAAGKAFGDARQSLVTIYICGEESPQQVKLRIERLSGEKKSSSINSLLFLPETDIDVIINKIQDTRYGIRDIILIVDSIQSLSTTDLSGVAGSISQVRESTQRLIKLAKTKQIPVFLVGHVTKKGMLAGPKTIEHAVDTVLYFEGERSGDLRLLRSVKNRFGPTDEVGVFQMTDKGLIEVKNPSSISLGEGFDRKIGSAYTVVFEGTRPMVVEIQGLITKSFAPLPKRIINGLDRRRSEMIIAVLQKYLKIPLWQYDIFLNVAGGFKVFEPAADLAVCAAIYSSYKNKALPAKSIFIGEVSLLGEVDKAGRMERRKKQVRALGFRKIFSAPDFKKLVQLKNLLK